jgi:hypothetical protein
MEHVFMVSGGAAGFPLPVEIEIRNGEVFLHIFGPATQLTVKLPLESVERLIDELIAAISEHHPG